MGCRWQGPLTITCVAKEWEENSQDGTSIKDGRKRSNEGRRHHPPNEANSLTLLSFIVFKIQELYDTT